MPGVVIDARVHFEDDPSRWKWRPVVVLGTRGRTVIVVPCTTVTRPGPGQLALRNWERAGLLHPTHATLRLRTVDEIDLGQVRGELTRDDLSRLHAVLSILST